MLDNNMFNVTEEELEEKIIFECEECGGHIYNLEEYFEIANEIICGSCIEEAKRIAEEEEV